MSIRTKLNRLERAAALKGTPDADEPVDDRAWLVEFVEWHADGLFPDPAFPDALAAYRLAIEQAEARADWEPPPSFLPSSGPLTRLSSWRSPQRFSGVDAAWQALACMLVPAAA